MFCIVEDPLGAIADLETVYREAAALGARASTSLAIRALVTATHISGMGAKKAEYEAEWSKLNPESKRDFWSFDPNDPLLALKGQFVDVVRDIDDPREFILELVVLRRRALRARVPKLATLCLEGLVRRTRELGDHRRALRYAQRLVLEEPTPANLNALAQTQLAIGREVAARKSFSLAMKLAATVGDIDQVDVARSALAEMDP